jgi:hypothetical protein
VLFSSLIKLNTPSVAGSFVHASFHVQAELADVRTLEIPALETSHKEAAARLSSEVAWLKRCSFQRPKTLLTCSCVQAELADVRTLEIPALETRHKEAAARLSSEVAKASSTCSCAG